MLVGASDKEGLVSCNVHISEESATDNFANINLLNKRFGQHDIEDMSIHECDKIYVCGGPLFTKSIRVILQSANIDKDKIVYV